jgi:uncharacterized membrane protein HdeD (DUF308 family)
VRAWADFVAGALSEPPPDEGDRTMIRILMRNWWALALRGAVAILLGILAFLWPGMTLTVLVWCFAAYLLVDGVFAVVAGLRAAQGHERWWPLAIEGGLDLLAAAVALLWPGLVLLTFIYIAAGWAILTGLVLALAALRLRAWRGFGSLLAGGVLSLGWGIVVILWPIAGEVALAWWIGAYAIFFGVFMLSFGLQLRRHLHDSDRS